MSRILGVDVSHYQGEIDFDVLAASDAEFVIIKATQNAKNPAFDRNWAEAKRVGLPRGAYHLAELDKDIQEQVFMYLSVVHFEPGDLPPVLDIETSKIDEVGDPKLAYERILEWLQTVEQLTGATPILYISPRGVDHLEGNTEGLNRYHLWDVDYEDPEPGLTQQPKLPETFETWTIWQWTSSGPGPEYGMESDDLDLDYFDGCIHELQEFLAMNQPENPWNIDIPAAQKYNDDRNYERELIYNIITFTEGNPWYSDDVILSIAYWQYQHGDLAVDGKVGPATLQAMIDAGMPVP
jgi:lysozyme